MKRILLLAAVLIGLNTAGLAQKTAPTVSPENAEVQNTPTGYRLVGKYQDTVTKTYYLIFSPEDDNVEYGDFRIFYGLAGKDFPETQNNGGSGALYELVFSTTLGKIRITRGSASKKAIVLNGKEIPLERIP